MLFKACVLLEQFFFNKLCQSVFTSPQIAADLKMQTNMHLRSPGGELPCALSLGLLQALSKVNREAAQKVRMCTQEQRPRLVPPTNASWCRL